MPRRKLTLLQRQTQPISWRRAIFSGFLASSLMMSFVDIFKMLGITGFSFEYYLGVLLSTPPYGSHSGNIWMVGAILNAIVGSVFGTFYAYLFEYVLKKSTVRLGVYLGFIHALVAGVFLFPFFQILHEQMGTGVYTNFGFFGSGMGGATPIILLFAHLMFGAFMGLFYGPVRLFRLRMNQSEPGESALPWETEDVIPTDEEERSASSGRRVIGG